MVNEVAKKKKYSRDGENPTPWSPLSLAFPKGGASPGMTTGIKPWENYFYGSSDFSVKNYLYSKSLSLKFPEYTLMSNNFYDKSWSFKTHRRLKNVIVVMDFCPSKSALQEMALGNAKFTIAQEKNLQRAFTIADSEKSGGISAAEVVEVLKAVDVNFEGDDGDEMVQKMFQSVNLSMTGTVSFDQVKDMMAKSMIHRIQAGRYYVALSLAEAECMRAVMHAQSGSPLIPGKDTIVALRSGKTILDKTVGYCPAETYQDLSSQACYRFIDNEVNYLPRELSFLVRSLEANLCEKRREFFMEVRSNRRRKQDDLASKPIAKVFATPDETHVVHFKIASGRIIAMLKSRGMYARDAFAAIDTDRDGLLNFQELRKGLEWLGLKIDTALVREFIRQLDKDNDGYINLQEFKGAVGWEENDKDAANIAQYNGTPAMPSSAPEGGKVTVRVPETVLASIKIKVKRVTKFTKIWTSQGSMSRQKGSVWKPEIKGVDKSFRQNKTLVPIGHYCGSDFDNPNRDSTDRLTIEVTDTSGNWVGGSNWLALVLDRYMPYPARFRLSWSLTHGSNPFYAWEPVPPGDGFVALGMVGTTTENPPDIKCVRCVTIDWVRESKYLKKVWVDSGSGGREGSLWLFNTLNLVGFVAGHDPPRQKVWDLKSQRFFMKEFTDTRASRNMSATNNMR